MKQKKNFPGYLFAKLFLIGSKSEGPAYFLQQWDYGEFPVVKKVHLWEEDPELHKFLGKKVTFEGTMTEEGIKYYKVTELQHLIDEKKKLNIELKIPEVLWVNKMIGRGSVKQYMPLTLAVEWPYHSIWKGTCPTSQTYDFMIEKDGKIYWKWSADKEFLQVITPVINSGGKPVEHTVFFEFLSKEIQQDGTYTAKALFIASNQTVEKNFEIKFS